MLLKHFEEKKREKKRKRVDNETRERQRCGGAFVKQRGHPTFCSQFDTQTKLEPEMGQIKNDLIN